MSDAKPLIESRQLERTYAIGAEKVRALRGVDLLVKANEYVAVMGHSGSGKSTLMNVLGCLDRADKGTYHLNGINTTRMGEGQLAHIRNRQIGFVFQSFELMGRLSALKNVELPLIYSNIPFWKRRQMATEALQRVGLGERISHKPNQLSGGEKQRVAVARALVNQPSLLLADEPTGNLDTTTSEGIMQLFEKLYCEGQTIIMVTHEADIAVRARRVVRMRDGQVVSDLPTDQDPAWRTLNGNGAEGGGQ